MLAQFEAFENSFGKKYPLVWWGTLVGPLIVTLAIIIGLGLEYGWAFVGKLASTAIIAFFVFGRFIILGGGDAGSDEIRMFLTSAQLFALMTYLDLFVAVILSFHIGFLFKLPVLGPKVSELVADGQVILKLHPWMRRMTFFGLAAFVIFPLAATGSVGGSIFGRLLGMSRWSTLLGIAVGSIIGNGMMYVGSDVINRYLDKDNPLLFWGGVVVIVGLIILLERRYRKMKQDLLA
ncbi:small multi-drug export protein [bacterium]|nr:small multi-drug export protein [bacterium]